MAGAPAALSESRLVRKADITAELVTGLIADQFPRWADLAVRPVEADGIDNTTFRLGPTMSVRLPSADPYIEQVDKEHRWLPVLARQLPLPIPEPLAKGAPGRGFPRPWSVYRWIDGDPATPENINDMVRFATELAAFLGALYRIDPADGPGPGQTAPRQGCLPDARFSLDGYQPRLPRFHPGDDLRDPAQLRRPPYEDSKRGLPVLHAPTPIPLVASATLIGRA